MLPYAIFLSIYHYCYQLLHMTTQFSYTIQILCNYSDAIYEQNGHVYVTILQEIVYVPCPLEDQNGFLVSNLDDGHILLIGRVLEIKPKELVVFI